MLLSQVCLNTMVFPLSVSSRSLETGVMVRHVLWPQSHTSEPLLCSGLGRQAHRSSQSGTARVRGFLPSPAATSCSPLVGSREHFLAQIMPIPPNTSYAK